MAVDAWDVYLIYASDARWDGSAPPAPSFWMHQLALAKGPELDPEIFAQRLTALLGPPTADAAPGEPR